MRRKDPRLEKDVINLAAQLRRTHIPSQSIKSWQRRQLPRIHRLIREGDLGWVEVAAALNMASITPEPDKLWTGRMLAAETARVRKQLRSQNYRCGQLWADVESVTPKVRRGLLAWFRMHFKF